MIESTQQIEINLPIEEVMLLFQEQEHFKKWQKGLISSRNITDSIGKIGSKREMKIKIAGTSITMVEEITKTDLPHAWEAVYKSKGVKNFQYNRFRESEKNTNSSIVKTTTWESRSVFKFSGFMRFIAKAQPDTFKKQTINFMKDFKLFAENQVDQ